ncbi:hypothetical protein D3C71_780260 [compost metagenome]
MVNDTIQRTEGLSQRKTLPNNTEQTETDEHIKPFRSLAPIDDADTMGNYCKALAWALENREENDIKNIALTGPYGSGKSSILKTFVRKAKKSHQNLHFLHISLATFKEEITAKTNNKNTDEKVQSTNDGQTNTSEDETLLLRQIEYSILQQIFYHVKHEDIPHTRFRKQRSLSEEAARKWTSGIFLFTIALLFEVYHKQFWDTLRITPIPALQIYYHGIAWLFIGICGYNFIKQSVNSLHTIKLRKFNLKNAEFAIDNSFEKSILNEHLDEILYFFDATRYNVVIIEDLDRFNKTEIFTKLREINQLINNKEGRKSTVTFIYAVRDNMFLDRNRTKFFDFIIPVIPVVSPSNSNDILRRLVNENKYKINSDLLDGIAAYVDDMRLLYNIMNEFYIYHHSLNEKLDQNKLLALILYKNTYPSDFVALSKREGELYTALNEKELSISTNTEKIDQEIGKLKEEKKDLESIQFMNEKDLRKLYILECLTTKDPTIEFHIDGKQLDFEDMLEEGLFRNLVNGKAKQIIIKEDNVVTVPITTDDFKFIQKRVDENFTYDQKLEQIKKVRVGEISKIDDQILQLEQKKLILRQGSIRELMESDLLNLTILEHKQQQLVSILLRSGYIDEYYESYISIFYAESISRTDADFLLNVQARIQTDFDYVLTHCDALINRIKPIEFEREFVLNFGLVDFLLTKKAPVKVRNKVFKFLSNESEISLAFLDGYLIRGKRVDQFMNALAYQWSGMWSYLIKEASVNKNIDKPALDLDYYFQLIIQHANVADIAKMAENSALVDYISNRSDFLTIPAKGTKLNDVIRLLNIKFKDLDLEKSPEHLVEFIFSGSFYEININMLHKWFILKDGFNENEFWSQNYSRINDSFELDPVIEYIGYNLPQYIGNVWLNLDKNQQEHSYVFEEFLQSNDLSHELKYAIIKKCSSRIENIDHFEDSALISLLLNENKVEATWLNLLKYYDRNGQNFDSIIIAFLNFEENAFDLQIETLDGKNKIDNAVVHKFGEELLLCNQINDKYYGDLIASIPWSYNSGLAFEKLSKRKVEHLLDLLEPSWENFRIIKNHFPSLRADLLEKNPEDFVKEIDEYRLDSDDIETIITSPGFSVEQKSIVIESNAFLILNDSTLLEEIAIIGYNNEELILADSIIRAILKNETIPVEQRIGFTYRIFENMSRFEQQTILQNWEEPYNVIGSNTGTAILKRNKVNLDFAAFLKRIGTVKKVELMAKTIKLSNDNDHLLLAI